MAGVIRHRALRIAQTLNIDNAATRIDSLFGREPKTRLQDRVLTEAEKAHVGSRVTVRETEIQDVKSMLQNRIRIDRFTGGVLDNYLFNEMPVFGGPNSVVTIDVRIRNPKQWEIGLLLLVLKDLWTADLPIGGGANVGRGRVHGTMATLTHQQEGGEQAEVWHIKQVWAEREPGPLTVETEGTTDLQIFVDALTGGPSDA